MPTSAQVLHAYRTICAFPKAVYNGLVQHEKITMEKAVDATLHQLSEQLAIKATDRKVHEAELRPGLAQPAQKDSLAALMEREETRRLQAVSTMRASACSCREAVVLEVATAQRTLHNAAHIVGQMLNSWVLPQDLVADVSNECSDDVAAIQVLPPVVSCQGSFESTP